MLNFILLCIPLQLRLFVWIVIFLKIVEKELRYNDLPFVLLIYLSIYFNIFMLSMCVLFCQIKKTKEYKKYKQIWTLDKSWFKIFVLNQDLLSLVDILQSEVSCRGIFSFYHSEKDVSKLSDQVYVFRPSPTDIYWQNIDIKQAPPTGHPGRCTFLC